MNTPIIWLVVTGTAKDILNGLADTVAINPEL